MNCTTNTPCMVMSGGEPLALVTAVNGGSVLGFAADADAATIFPTVDDAEAAIERTPHPERLQARIVRLIPSSVTLEPDDAEITDDSAALVSPSATDVRTTADNGGRS